MSKVMNDDGWVSYGTWPEGWESPDVGDVHVSILSSQYERLGGYKALCFGRPQFMPKGWHQWIVFLWGTDVWFGRWPFCKCVVAANVLVWVLGAL